MSELKFRTLQTINFIVVALFSLIVQILYEKDILSISNMCIPLFTLTMIIMVVIQLCNYLEKNDKGKYIGYLYFVILCCMMYYSKHIIDVIIFVLNIIIIFSIMVERYVYIDKDDKTENK